MHSGRRLLIDLGGNDDSAADDQFHAGNARYEGIDLCEREHTDVTKCRVINDAGLVKTATNTMRT